MMAAVSLNVHTPKHNRQRHTVRITDDTLVELTQQPPAKTTEKAIGQYPGLRFKHYAGSGAIPCAPGTDFQTANDVA